MIFFFKKFEVSILSYMLKIDEEILMNWKKSLRTSLKMQHKEVENLNKKLRNMKN